MSKITVLCTSVVNFVRRGTLLATESIFTCPNSFSIVFLDMIGCYYQIPQMDEAWGTASVSSTALSRSCNALARSIDLLFHR